MLRKRWIIQTINDQLKNIPKIEDSGYRSPINFIVNDLAGLPAHIWQPKQAKALSLW